MQQAQLPTGPLHEMRQGILQQPASGPTAGLLRLHPSAGGDLGKGYFGNRRCPRRDLEEAGRPLAVETLTNILQLLHEAGVVLVEGDRFGSVADTFARANIVPLVNKGFGSLHEVR